MQVPADLPVMQETLLYEYLSAGGIAEMEARFGKATRRYETYADDASAGYYELADGRFYSYQYGFDAQGTAVVMCHTVEAIAGQKPTAGDLAFIAAISDGKTTSSAAATYVRKVAGAGWKPPSADPKGPKVPAYAWDLPDGSGFLVVDMTGLSATEMKALEMDVSEPYQELYWDASHWRES